MCRQSLPRAPHIAGHTLEGKYSGTQMVYEAICDLAGQTPEKSLDDFLPERPNLHVDLELCSDQGDNLAPALLSAEIELIEEKHGQGKAGVRQIP